MKLVTFSGLDGSGKTTLIDALMGALAARGLSVARLTMYDHIVAYGLVRRVTARLRARKSASSVPDQSTRPIENKGLAIVRSRVAKTLVLPVDLMLFLLIKRRVARRRTDILVLDRYFYDAVVELHAADAAWARIFLRSVPRPAAAIFVDVAPAVAFARKGEYSVEELSVREQEYRRLFAGLDTGRIIPNDSLDDAKARLMDAVFEALGVSRGGAPRSR